MSSDRAPAALTTSPTLLTQAGRRRLFDNLTLAFAILGTLGLGVMLVSPLVTERALLLQVLVTVLVVWILALLRRLPLMVRAGGLLLLTLLLVVRSAGVGGVAELSRPLLVVGTLFAIAFLGRRAGFVSLFAAILIFAVLGMLQAGGGMDVVTPDAVVAAENWIFQAARFALILVLAGFVLLQIVNNSRTVLERQQALTQRLAEEQAQRAEQVAERTRALQTAAEIGRNLTQILNPDDLLATLVSSVRQAFNFYHVQYYELDEQGEMLLLRSATGEVGRQLRERAHRLSVSEGIVGRAATMRSTVLVGEVGEFSKFASNPLLPETRAELAVPVLAGEKLLGVIDVQHHVAHALSASDARLLEIVAGQAGAALRNAVQFQAAEARARAAARRNRLREMIQGTADVETLLRIAARELGQALDAEHTTVFIDAGLLSEAAPQEASQ